MALLRKASTGALLIILNLSTFTKGKVIFVYMTVAGNKTCIGTILHGCCEGSGFNFQAL